MGAEKEECQERVLQGSVSNILRLYSTVQVYTFCTPIQYSTGVQNVSATSSGRAGSVQWDRLGVYRANGDIYNGRTGQSLRGKYFLYIESMRIN